MGDDYEKAFQYDWYRRVGRHIERYCADIDKLSVVKQYAEENNKRGIKNIVNSMEKMCEKNYMSKCKQVVETHNATVRTHETKMTDMMNQYRQEL